MARMVRKQVYMGGELDRALATRAADLGVTQAEVVREALGRYLAETTDETHSAAADRLRELWAESDAAGYGGGWRTSTREEWHERPGDARREHPDLRGRQHGGREDPDGS
jgi:predicted DNA-binding protein